MTVKLRGGLQRAWSVFIQVQMVVLINIPTVSFGLAVGWVSLVSGEAGEEAGGEGSGRAAVVAAVTTFAASMAGVPLSARALQSGRKFALIGTSACFVVCWSLKLLSVWCGAGWAGAGAALVVTARVAAGLGGASAWALEPLLVQEMCSSQYQGAAVSALSLAYNFGILAMYLAADAAIPHKTVLLVCLALALVHCIVFSFVPESPSFLAAKGKMKEARAALARLRGVSVRHPALGAALAALPRPRAKRPPARLARHMLSDRQRRRAFIIGTIAVIGQEVCGVLAILQYAERLFVIARDETRSDVGSQLTSGLSGLATGNITMESALHNFTSTHPGLASQEATVQLPKSSVPAELVSPARHAVLLGAVQLVASALSMYLVERLGRRSLLLWCALVTGAALSLAALVLGARLSRGALSAADGAALAISLAVAADSAGLQHVPYVIIAEMFHYEYRGCALMLAIAGACFGNAVEVAVFPAVVAGGGLTSALGLAAALTFAYALFVALAVPETKGRTPEQIYDAICPAGNGGGGGAEKVNRDVDCVTNKETMCTKV